MSIHPFLTMEGTTQRPLRNSPNSTHTYYRATQAQTPPGSTSGSPKVKIEEFTSLPGLRNVVPTEVSSPVKLPSLGEFDQGVEDLIRAHGPVKTEAVLSPLHGLTRNPTILEPLATITQPQPSWSMRNRSAENLVSEQSNSRRGTILRPNQYPFPTDYSRQSMGSFSNQDTYYGYGSSQSLHGLPGMDCYPSPPPEGGESRHINQKYTTEEGDYIIYAWHDKKMKWQQIKQEFAARFGNTPERTVQGLQAWYYRMNQRIPIWDQEGWLCFDNEDDLEPQHVSIKCRERDSQDKPSEPLGLAQRYPERAIHYSWVDPEIKFKSSDWAAKRAMQYRDRRERRRRKEQRRLKL
ncbi:hypothetical protein FPOAC1_010718 [Fusarium poae]|uniref:hypothetical protein n=1 Tax=Fusarium poae TaxID=36050 RepID=UPI001CE840A5|nr:hypothetical protein FPOAC1_010718 [Fusarium poae]KAG8665917.1 hypothetical protein FPOAC1_010718 [Fusarium poae]